MKRGNTCHGPSKHHHGAGRHHHHQRQKAPYGAGVNDVDQGHIGDPRFSRDPPLEITSRGHQGAVVDTGKCVGCGKCERACPRGAITVMKVAVIHRDTCRGCGQCVETCARNAISWL